METATTLPKAKHPRSPSIINNRSARSLSEEEQFAALAADELFKNLHVSKSFKKFLEDQHVNVVPSFLEGVRTDGVESLV